MDSHSAKSSSVPSPKRKLKEQTPPSFPISRTPQPSGPSSEDRKTKRVKTASDGVQQLPSPKPTQYGWVNGAYLVKGPNGQPMIMGGYYRPPEEDKGSVEPESKPNEESEPDSDSESRADSKIDDDSQPGENVEAEPAGYHAEDLEALRIAAHKILTDQQSPSTTSQDSRDFADKISSLKELIMEEARKIVARRHSSSPPPAPVQYGWVNGSYIVRGPGGKPMSMGGR